MGKIDKSNVEAVFPLTPPQESILLHHLINPAVDTGFLQLRGRLSGQWNAEHFLSSWKAVVAAHGTLRTSVHWEGLKHPVQVVHKTVDFALHVEDWSKRTEREIEQGIGEYLQVDRHKGLALSQAPAMRVAVFKSQVDECFFVWSCHHILLDGWSGALVLDEVLERYAHLCRGEDAAPPEVTQFADFAHWLRRQDRSMAAAFWSRQFPQGGESQALLVSPEFDARKREAKTSEVQMASIRTASVKRCAREWKVTPAAIYLTSWALTLSHFLDTQDVCFGLSLAGRSAPVDGIDRIVGMFATTLPMRYEFDESAGIPACIQGVFRRLREIQDFDWCHLSEVSAWSGRPPARPLFDSLFTLGMGPQISGREEREGGLRLSAFEGAATSSYPLMVGIVEKAHPALFMLLDTTRLEEKQGRDFAERFEYVLSSILTQAEKPVADLLPAGERSSAERAPAHSEATESRSEDTPGSRMETLVLRVWEEMFDRRYMGVHENFFELGGHSLLAARLTARLSEVLGQSIPLNLIFQAPTVAALATALEDTAKEQWPVVVPIRTSGSAPPLFLVHEMGGSLFMYEQLAKHLPHTQPVFGVQPDLELSGDVEVMAQRYVKALKERFPEGPVALGGYCFGGAVAYAMAGRLRAEGYPVNNVIVIDLMFPNLVRRQWRYLWARLRRDSLREMIARSGRAWRRVRANMTRRGSPSQPGKGGDYRELFDVPDAPDVTVEMISTHYRAMEQFDPKSYDGAVTLIRSRSPYSEVDPNLGWGRLAKGPFTSCGIDCLHAVIMKPPHLEAVASAMTKALGE